MTTRHFLWLFLASCGGTDPVRPADRGGDTDVPPPTTDTVTTPPEPELPASCDAGTNAWVERVFPVVLGRRPHGAAEVAMWSEMADTYGRDAVVRALAGDELYLRWWKLFFTDALYVARAGDKEYSECFENPEMTAHDGSLTAFIRSNPPENSGGFGEPWNMADVIVDGLAADDLSAIYQSHLFARMKKPTTGANVSEEELEYNRRVNFGAVFLDTYVNRDLVCITCHNSEFSTTPDRTFGSPGLYEKALFGASTGTPSVDEVYAMFKYHDLVVDAGGKRPWGMDGECGEFNLDVPPHDYLDQVDQYWIDPYDATGTVWDVERSLATGSTEISGVGITVNTDLSLDGNQAFAWLVAQNVVDQVWQYAMGNRLTIAYSFGRNPDQAERLHDLTEKFVTSGWSLRELLVAIATDPTFNQGLPETCPSQPYGLPAIFDPYTVEDLDPARHGNGPGDIVHRHSARALMSSLHEAMGWPAADEYFGLFGDSDEQEFQASIGVFLRESEPGFNGSDFQGLLSWESEYVTCRNPAKPDDNLKAMYDDAVAGGNTVEELVAAVKDRLVANGALDAEERPLVEALMGVPLDSAVADADPGDFSRKLGLFCGAILESPDWYLAIDPLPIGPVPALALGIDDDCQHVLDLMGAEGVTGLTCSDGVPGPAATGTTN